MIFIPISQFEAPLFLPLKVLGMPSKKNVIVYGCCSEPYPDITYTLHLKRRSSFYIFNLLIPCMMISFLAPLGFYLPADSGEKVSLGVTVLLALTVFQLMVAESMPPSESVPLIGQCYFWGFSDVDVGYVESIPVCLFRVLIYQVPITGLFWIVKSLRQGKG